MGDGEERTFAELRQWCERHEVWIDTEPHHAHWSCSMAGLVSTAECLRPEPS